jgi:hypothetical protein
MKRLTGENLGKNLVLKLDGERISRLEKVTY